MFFLDANNRWKFLKNFYNHYRRLLFKRFLPILNTSKKNHTKQWGIARRINCAKIGAKSKHDRYCYCIHALSNFIKKKQFFYNSNTHSKWLLFTSQCIQSTHFIYTHTNESTPGGRWSLRYFILVSSPIRHEKLHEIIVNYSPRHVWASILKSAR